VLPKSISNTLSFSYGRTVAAYFLFVVFPSLLPFFLSFRQYRVLEGSSLEDKLQTCNKINAAIRRHFGKQVNKETKLRIHNITVKAVLKFGSEAWVLKKREEQRLEAA